MIDFHSHILPGLDDGSRNIQETCDMLRMQQQQGVTKIIATPHFYAHHDSVDTFLAERRKAMQEVGSLSLRENWVPEIIAGAEVYYFPGMGQAQMLSKMCIEGTSLLLLELPFVQWTKEMYAEVQSIIEKQCLTVILAHVERYYEFQKKKRIWEEMLQLPVYVQVNSSSLHIRKQRKAIFQLVQDGFPVLLGSDCHNTVTRPPNLEEGRNILCRKFGKNILEDIECRGKEMLEIYETQ